MGNPLRTSVFYFQGWRASEMKIPGSNSAGNFAGTRGNLGEVGEIGGPRRWDARIERFSRCGSMLVCCLSEARAGVAGGMGSLDHGSQVCITVCMYYVVHRLGAQDITWVPR